MVIQLLAVTPFVAPGLFSGAILSFRLRVNTTPFETDPGIFRKIGISMMQAIQPVDPIQVE
jgi:hypothetical protein